MLTIIATLVVATPALGQSFYGYVPKAADPASYRPAPTPTLTTSVDRPVYRCEHCGRLHYRDEPHVPTAKVEETVRVSHEVIDTRTNPEGYFEVDPEDRPPWVTDPGAIDVDPRKLVSLQHPEWRYGGRPNRRETGDIRGETPVEREVDFFRMLEKKGGANIRELFDHAQILDFGNKGTDPWFGPVRFDIATYPTHVYYMVWWKRSGKQTVYKLYDRLPPKAATRHRT